MDSCNLHKNRWMYGRYCSLNFIFFLPFVLDSLIRIQESLNQVLECEALAKSGSSELSPVSFTGKAKTLVPFSFNLFLFVLSPMYVCPTT